MSLLPKPTGIIDDVTDEVKTRKKKDYNRKGRPLGVDRLDGYPDMDERVKSVIKDYIASWNPKAQYDVAKDLSKKYGADVGVVYVLNEVGEATLLFFGGLSIGAPYLILAAPFIDSEPFVFGSYKAMKKMAKKGVKDAKGWFRKATKKERKAIESAIDDIYDIIL